MFIRNRFPLMNTAGDGGAGGAGGAGDGGGAPPAGGGAGGAPPVGGAGTGNPWFSGFTAPDVKGYIENKGFKDAEALASAYMNLEKTRGVPADRLLTLPGDDKPESWAPIYDRLGRPKDGKGYELKGTEGQPADFVEWQRGVFHELGLTKKQGEALSGKWNQLVAASVQKDADDAKAALSSQIDNLKKEWGTAAEKNIEVVDDFVAKAGITEDQAKAIERAIGFDVFAKIAHGIVTKFGIQLGEAKFHSGQTTGNDFGAMTPSAATAKIAELMSNKEWKDAWIAGDKAKQRELDELYAKGGTAKF